MSENRAGSHEMCMSPTRGGGQAEAESVAVVGTSVVDLKSRSRSSSALSFPCSLKKIPCILFKELYIHVCILQWDLLFICFPVGNSDSTIWGQNQPHWEKRWSYS